MSSRGRSPSPHPLGDRDADIDMDRSPTQDKPLAKVVIVTNLSRNVVESHLRSIFGFYGDISKIDLPLFGKSGQNRGKAALEFTTSTAAHKAASHMDGGQLDGAVLKVELSDLPIRSPSRSPRFGRNGRDVDQVKELLYILQPFAQSVLHAISLSVQDTLSFSVVLLLF
ncbi:hypothetical protein ACEPAG_6192 [Sanghuangporus baumii]